MALDALLATIILVAFLVTIIIAIGSYLAYKLRESRGPRSISHAGSTAVFFEPIRAAELAGEDGEGT